MVMAATYSFAFYASATFFVTLNGGSGGGTDLGSAIAAKGPPSMLAFNVRELQCDQTAEALTAEIKAG